MMSTINHLFLLVLPIKIKVVLTFLTADDRVEQYIDYDTIPSTQNSFHIQYDYSTDTT